MASKRQKKKQEKMRQMAQQELVVNFIQEMPQKEMTANVEAALKAEPTDEPEKAIKISVQEMTGGSTKMKMNFYIQYMGKEYNEQDIINAIKQEWKSEGNKVGDMKSLDIYVKVEEGKAYYIVNGSIHKELAL